MDNIDLRMLEIFDHIHRGGSLSRAAERLGIGQPAVSMALAKLRRHYGDPLFVRSGAGMAPTPLADAVAGPLRQALGILTSALQHRVAFDPASSDRMFGVCMTDIGQRVMMPRLLAHLRATAPAVCIDLSYVSETTPADLASGRVDLALGFLAGLDAGILQQGLFTESFVCLASSRHPRLRGATLTLAQFEREAHLVVATHGTGHGVVETTLAGLGIRRRVGLRIPNFLGVVSNIVDTDYLAIVPQRFGQIVARNDGIKLLALPFALPPYRVMQHWHARYGHDPGVTWLRQTVASLFSDADS